MSNIVVLAAGERCISLAQKVRRARKDTDFTLVNARFLKPFDGELLSALPQKYVVTIEDNVLIGGLGDAVARFYRNSGKEVYSLGYDDAFIPHGSPASLAAKHGVSAETLARLLGELHARG